MFIKLNQKISHPVSSESPVPSHEQSPLELLLGVGLPHCSPQVTSWPKKGGGLGGWSALPTAKTTSPLPAGKSREKPLTSYRTCSHWFKTTSLQHVKECVRWKANPESELSGVPWGSKPSSTRWWTCSRAEHLAEDSSDRHNTHSISRPQPYLWVSFSLLHDSRKQNLPSIISLSTPELKNTEYNSIDILQGQ